MCLFTMRVCLVLDYRAYGSFLQVYIILFKLTRNGDSVYRIDLLMAPLMGHVLQI